MNLKCIIALLSSVAISASAQSPTPPDAAAADPHGTTPVQLDRFVVLGELDRARESLVPALGATTYEIGGGELLAQSQGLDAGFNQTLLRVPGMAEDSFGQLHLRGEHANLQYRLNDVLLPEGISGFGQELDTRFIETVSILTGSLPAQFGYRTAGVIDLHTKSGGRTPISDASVYVGSHATFRPSAELGGSAGRLDYYLTVSSTSNEIGIENPAPTRNPVHDRTEQLKGFGYFSYVFDSSSRVSLIISASDAKFQIPNRAGQTPAFTLDGRASFDSNQLNEKQREENGYAILSYQKTLANSGLQVSAFTRGSSIKFTPDAVGDLIFNGVASQVKRSIVTSGLQTDARRDLGAGHTIRAGFILTVDRAQTDTRTSVFATDTAGEQTSSHPFTLSQSPKKNGSLFGSYLQDEWQVTSALTINYGLRADGVSAYVHEGQTSPRINLVYTINPATSVHLGYARYFTPPPLELIDNSTVAQFAGTTNAAEISTGAAVQSERSHYFDAGIAQRVTHDFAVTIDGYYKKSRAQLDEGQFGQALVFSPFNYARGKVYGLEFGANYARSGLSLYANGAVSRALGESISSGQFQFGQDELDYIANHYVHLDHDQHYTASAGVSYKYKKSLAYIDLLYGSGLRRGFANTQKISSYAPVNTGFEQDLAVGGHRTLKLRVDIVNVFDRIYELRDGSGIGVGAPQYGARRGYFGGVSLAF